MINKTETSPQYFSTEPQQANRSTSQRVFGGLMRPKSLGPFGSVWVRRVRLRELKHRFNPLKTQLTPIFLTNIPPPTHSHRFFEKKSHRFNRFNKQNSKWHVTCCPPLTCKLITRWPVGLLTRWLLKKIGEKIPNSHEVVGGGMMWQLPKLWRDSGAVVWGFLYVFNSFYTIGKLWEGLCLVITVSFNNGVKYNI